MNATTTQECLEVMAKIERVLTGFVQILKSGVRPTIFLPDADDENMELLELNQYNAYRFLFVSRVLLNVYALLKTNSYRTKRDLYYEYKSLFRTQRSLDYTVKLTTRLLQENPLNLHLLAASKGLVMGDLTFKMHSRPGEEAGEVSCHYAPVAVPVLPTETFDFRSNARFILVAEKDSLFQNCVDGKICSKLGPSIVVTAKGYPDYATRVFLHRMQTALDLPVFALVDGDPYGIEIYLTYKYGPQWATQQGVHDIILPKLEIIGVFPTEAETLGVDDAGKLELCERERKKALAVLNRCQTLAESYIVSQLKHLIQVNYKIEIEAIAALGMNYITENYLPNKLTKLLPGVATASQQRWLSYNEP